METFADVLHSIIDTVFTGDVAEKAHSIIDSSSGTRTEEPAEEAAEAPAAVEEGATEAPATSTVSEGADATEDVPPTPGG